MELKDIASVSGKGGLFKILKPTRTGVILEAFDEKKTKIVANINSRVSVLNEISIYTTTEEGSEPLENVLVNTHEEFGDDLGVSGSSSPEELKSFFKFVLPEYDVDRVYVSDIKKVVNWYKQLLQHVPELLQRKEEETTDAKDSASQDAGDSK